ncbi:MAG: aspartate/glutamate racemase family protein [Herbaspirillum sp.]|nr:aspartate/glutamate racemase family protein [Herbaspirillum sp.]
MKLAEINHQFYEKIGLIGGMGSGATIETYRKIMKFARYEGSFSPHLIINNLPQENIFDQLEENLATMICHGIEDLASAGASVVGISCNTAHIYIKSIKAEAARRQIKFVNMIDSVVDHSGKAGTAALVFSRLLRGPRFTDMRLRLGRWWILGHHPNISMRSIRSSERCLRGESDQSSGTVLSGSGLACMNKAATL